MTTQLLDAETATERTYRLDRAHVFHSWSAQAALDPMVIERAAGCHVWDGAGRRYLDFSSQLVNTNVGHQRTRGSSRPSRRRPRSCAPSRRSTPTTRAARPRG